MIPQMPAKQTRPPVSKSPSAPASSKEKTEMMIDFYDQIPQGPDDPLLARRVLKLFGLRIAWSSYRRHVPATSGAPVGITDSTWIYTAKWAYGRGRVSDWALLQNIEIKIGPAAPIASETGTSSFSRPCRCFRKTSKSESITGIRLTPSAGYGSTTTRRRPKGPRGRRCGYRHVPSVGVPLRRSGQHAKASEHPARPADCAQTRRL